MAKTNLMHLKTRHTMGLTLWLLVGCGQLSLWEQSRMFPERLPRMPDPGGSRSHRRAKTLCHGDDEQRGGLGVRAGLLQLG